MLYLIIALIVLTAYFVGVAVATTCDKAEKDELINQVMDLAFDKQDLEQEVDRLSALLLDSAVFECISGSVDCGTPEESTVVVDGVRYVSLPLDVVADGSDVYAQMVAETDEADAQLRLVEDVPLPVDWHPAIESPAYIAHVNSALAVANDQLPADCEQ